MTFHDFSKAQPFAQGDENSNWDYVVDWPWTDKPGEAAIWYVARPGSGAKSGYMGDLNHIRKLIRRGNCYFTLTPLGEALVNGDKR